MTLVRVRRQSLYATCKIAVATVGRTKVVRSAKSARRNRYKLPGTGCRERVAVRAAASLRSLFAVSETFVEGLEKIFGSVRNNRAAEKLPRLQLALVPRSPAGGQRLRRRS